MNEAVFYWIGVGAVGAVLVAAVLAAIFYTYVLLIHDRLRLRMLRKTPRRLSLTAWYNAKLMNDEHFHGDDFPVNERPFLFTYQVGQRQFFILAGMLGPRRSMSITGQHPEERP